MSLITTLARAARRAAATLKAHEDTPILDRPGAAADTIRYQREVLHFLYRRRDSLHGGWVSIPEVAENVGRLHHDAEAALNALVCDGFAERQARLFRSRGVPAVPGVRSNVIPFPTRANVRAYSTILGDRGIGALA